MDQLNKTLQALKKRVAALDDAALNRLLRKMDKWFCYTKDGDGDMVRAALKSSHQKKVAFIMAGDPVVMEGGLISFLIESLPREQKK